MQPREVVIIRLFGLRRSGNHALMRWIGAQCDGEVYYADDVRADQHPTLETKPLFPEREPSDAGAVFHLLGYEDTSLRFAGRRPALPLVEHSPGANPPRWIDVLLLRTPWNLFASRLKRTIDLQGYQYHQDLFSMTGFWARRRTRVLWKEHATEFLGRSACLEEPVRVNYDRWCDDPGYRRELADDLGLEFDDSYRGKVWAAGGGSSFEKVEFDGQAEEMATTERWRVFLSRLPFRGFFADRELVALAGEIFGASEALEPLSLISKGSLWSRFWLFLAAESESYFVLRWRVHRPLWWARAAWRRVRHWRLGARDDR